MVTAPHWQAAESGADVLREGGNAIEAMLAVCATIAVVYPHMNALGGDAFWLVAEPGDGAVRALDACGPAAAAASRDWYRERGFDAIPVRGPAAANTVAGLVAGWHEAFEFGRTAWGGRLPRSRLLADAIRRARHGARVTDSQAAATAAKRDELRSIPGFAEAFLEPDATAPAAGGTRRAPALADTLDTLARDGFDAFHRGDIGATLAAGLAAAGSPVSHDDLRRYHAQWRAPLSLAHSAGTLWNFPPPTQGLVSLAILGILDRVGVADLDPLGVEYVHRCVEATKRAFSLRDRHVTDPTRMRVAAESLITDERLTALADDIDLSRAAPWPAPLLPGDTVWMGVVDADGRAVSCIQSIYHEFGSGIVLPGTGVLWQNRGCGFSLDPKALQALEPGRKPFHTLNPALARLADGRLLVYGTMGGDGQPQTQAATFTRIVLHGMDPADAIAAPRWLLGRTWGNASDTLKLESRFAPPVAERLARLGHRVEVLDAYDEAVGHAGAIVRGLDGALVGASDPRSDGAAVAA
ncbi:MAG: gamma-glutamyltransferase family protein [Burkholderiales bacterium]|jgi:gamma-glutamyltranspeptidase/glutathione hydrolase|nr:gamma-glutamyltransferase family protein [Burkholderiales bacterium]